jgi:septum formation protein
MLVLASNSPRRRQLLSLGGWNFIVLASEVDESILPEESPVSYVRRLSLKKAQDVLHRLTSWNRQMGIIVAADTAVVAQKQETDPITGIQAEILGKPADRYEAESMLCRLRACQHEVLTALTLIRISD